MKAVSKKSLLLSLGIKIPFISLIRDGTISKKLLLLSLCIVMAATFALASCSGGDSDTGGNDTGGTSTDTGGDASSDDGDAPAPTARDTLNIAASADAGTLDPIGISGNFLQIIPMYMEPLLDNKPGGEHVWVLATGIDPVSDIQYTMHLREGVTFNNGNPFTADDVLLTMKMYKDDPVRTINVQSIDFEKTAKTDDYTIDLWYTEYNAAQELMLSQMMIIDAESYDAESMSTNPVGTGPYVVTDYVVNSHITMKARDDYWGEKPAIPNLNFKVLNEASQVTNALETGDVDVAGVPTTDVDYIKSLGTYEIGEANAGMTISSWYNMASDSPLATKEARYAINYATDREAIVQSAFDGYAKVTTWPLSAACVDYEERFSGLSETYSPGYDMTKAKELAEESGLVGKSLRIMTNGQEAFITVAEIMQASLLEIGVNAEILNYDQATYFSLMMDTSNYEIALYFSSAPSVMASDIFATYPTFITQGWEGPEHDEYMKLSKETLGTSDPTEYSDKLMQVTEMFVDNSPWYGICEQLSLFAYPKDLQGFEFYLIGDLRYQEMSFAQ